MNKLIDFTPQLAEAYSRLIEAPGVSDAEIDHLAAKNLRELSNMDMSDLLYDRFEEIRDLVRDGDELEIGRIVAKEVNDYCRRVAERVLGVYAGDTYL